MNSSQSFQKGTQPCWHLYFSLVRPIPGFRPIKTIQCVVICYGGHRTLIHPSHRVAVRIVRRCWTRRNRVKLASPTGWCAEVGAVERGRELCPWHPPPLSREPIPPAVIALESCFIITHPWLPSSCRILNCTPSGLCNAGPLISFFPSSKMRVIRAEKRSYHGPWEGGEARGSFHCNFLIRV